MASKKPSGLGKGLGALLGADMMETESSGSLYLPISQVESCSGRKALLTTRKKISVARTLHWTILSVNGLLKKRKKKSGSFFWSMVLTLKH